MSRIAILHFSATGGTRLVAGLLGELLRKRRRAGDAAPGAVTVAGIEDRSARELAEGADFLVLCFPTYYLKPAPPMRDFVAALGPFASPKPCHLIATCELYSENCARRLAKLASSRGLVVTGSTVIRAPGSDVTAVLPARLVPWLYRFGRGFEGDLTRAAGAIAEAASASPAAEALPAPRWYSPFTQALQVVALDRFDSWKYRLKALDERCAGCGACASGCPAGALSMDGGKARITDAERCLLCCRCIHACPARAIVLRESLKDNRRIDAALLAGLEARARAGLGLDPGMTNPPRATAGKERTE